MFPNPASDPMFLAVRNKEVHVFKLIEIILNMT